MKSLLLALLLMSSSAFAMSQIESNLELESFTTTHHGCHGLHLTDDQKNQIKEIAHSTVAEIKKLIPAVKEAKKVLAHAMVNENTTKQEAIDARSNFSSAIHQVKALKKQAHLDIGFDVLTGEQRVKLHRCHHPRRRHHPRHGRGHGRGHGQGHGHGNGHGQN